MLPSSGTDTSIPPAPPADVDLSTSVGAEVTVIYTYVSDTRPPDPPTIVSSPPTFTADPNPVITFTAEAGAVTECLLATPTSAGSWGTVHQPVARRPRRGRRRALLVQRAGHRRRRQRRLGEHAKLHPRPDGAPSTSVDVRAAAARAERAPDVGVHDRDRRHRPLLARLVGPHRLQLTVRAGPQRRRRWQPHLLRLRRRRRRQHRDRPCSTPTCSIGLPLLAPTITTPPASPGNDPTPSWVIQLAPDAVTASCSVDGGPYTSCGTSFTADLSAAADGVHTMAVRNADPAGNQSTSTVSSYDLDRLAPGAPTITSPPSPSNVTTPVWSIASDAGTNTECRLDAGPWLPCTGIVHDDVRVGERRSARAHRPRHRRSGEPRTRGDRLLHARHHRAERPAHRDRARRPEQQPDADLDLHRRCRQHRDLLARRRTVGRLRLASPGRPHQLAGRHPSARRPRHGCAEQRGAVHGQRLHARSRCAGSAVDHELRPARQVRAPRCRGPSPPRTAPPPVAESTPERPSTAPAR